jgi:taurine dioxygenase
MSQTTEISSIDIVPTGRALGADVHGVDITKSLEAGEVHALETAWAEHLVLRLRGQSGVSTQHLADFTRNFGKLDKAPKTSQNMGVDYQWQHPEITVISNIKVGGKAIGALGDGESAWHSDMTYNVTPPKASCLYAVELPARGGNMEFANMYKAYETLPAALRKKVEKLECIHDASRDSTGQLRVGFVEITDASKSIGARHPVVARHPVTGKPSLYLGRRRGAYLVGLSHEDSEALLNQLWDHAMSREFVWTQVWQLGDVVMWDNRCTMHRADAIDPATQRLLIRTQLVGGAVHAY